ncbi:MAG: phosphoenolpyruvate carboxykinase (ATP) [Comamonadaceae bacterium]|nr:phosphoenolpyruvate carboxykinase (ATP) [Comamonadaceae bacterium]
MHCSANVGPRRRRRRCSSACPAPARRRSRPTRRAASIGDDEHGWSDNGVFNFEDGCYAKVIRLSADGRAADLRHARAASARSSRTSSSTRSRARIDLDDETLTENTRGAYPLEFIDNAVPEKRGGHPKNVIFLTCDASGVMPPIARLTPDQALYHFISGYTSQDRRHRGRPRQGAGDHLQHLLRRAVHGAPPVRLRRAAEGEDAAATAPTAGWSTPAGPSGPFGVGKRISIRHTRTLLDAVLGGKLRHVPFRKDAVFGFDVPAECGERAGLGILDPAATGRAAGKYDAKYAALAARFVENFQKLFAGDCPPEVVASRSATGLAAFRAALPAAFATPRRGAFRRAVPARVRGNGWASSFGSTRPSRPRRSNRPSSTMRP